MITPPTQAVDARTPYPLRRFAHDAMACTFELYLVEEDAKYAWQAAEAAFAEADRLEQELSRFVPTSDIARINALPPGQSLGVGIDAFECLQQAIRLYVETGGAFDITFGSQIDHDRKPESERFPTMHLLECDARLHEVTVRTAGVQIDLGGIGKGYAIDRMVRILRDWSIRVGLVHAGQSSVYAMGKPPDAATWRLALRSPLDPERTLGQVPLRNKALSGSGRQLHGQHIIDPATGRRTTGVAAAWALARSAAVSDALSTTFMVMSPEQVAGYCRQHPDVSAILAPQTPGERDLLCFNAEVT